MYTRFLGMLRDSRSLLLFFIIGTVLTQISIRSSLITFTAFLNFIASSMARKWAAQSVPVGGKDRGEGMENSPLSYDGTSGERLSSQSVSDIELLRIRCCSSVRLIGIGTLIIIFSSYTTDATCVAVECDEWMRVSCVSGVTADELLEEGRGDSLPIRSWETSIEAAEANAVESDLVEALDEEEEEEEVEDLERWVARLEGSSPSVSSS